MSCVIVIEFDVKAIEVCSVLFVHLLNQRFGAYAGSTCAYHNWGAVSVIGAKVKTLVSAHFLEADPDIGLEIFDQVPYVYRAVCVRQRRCHHNFARHSFPSK